MNLDKDLAQDSSLIKCCLCEKTGTISDFMRVPIFDPAGRQDVIEFVSYIKSSVHRECWMAWNLSEIISGYAIEDLAMEFNESLSVFKKEYAALFLDGNENQEFSNGCLVLNRSSKIYQNILGLDFDVFQLRGKSTNIRFIFDVFKSLDLKFQNEFTQKKAENTPTLEIICENYDKDFIKVNLNSPDKYGINLICFVSKLDLHQII